MNSQARNALSRACARKYRALRYQTALREPALNSSSCPNSDAGCTLRIPKSALAFATSPSNSHVLNTLPASPLFLILCADVLLLALANSHKLRMIGTKYPLKKFTSRPASEQIRRRRAVPHFHLRRKSALRGFSVSSADTAPFSPFFTRRTQGILPFDRTTCGGQQARKPRPARDLRHW